MKAVPPVSRNQRLRLEIAALNSEGQGVARVDGYALFVPGALMGEVVQASVIKPGKGYGVAKLIEVEQPSPARVFPLCPAFGRCGGCALQHMSYAEQLRHKGRVVQDALQRIGGFQSAQVQPVLGMEHPWQYRNKGSFPFAMVDGRVEAGFFAPRSHRLIPLNSCDIQHPAVLQAVFCARDWANAHGIPAYDEEAGKGLLRHVVARVSATGEVMVLLVAKAPPPHTKDLCALLRERVPGLKSIYLNSNPADTNVILGPEFRLLYGSERIEERLHGLTFSIGPASFLQVNTVQAEKLYQTGLDLLQLQGTERVVDAYCGIGTISLLLALRAKEVVGLETVRPAVEDAVENAGRNGIKNTLFRCGPAEALLPALLEQGFAPDVIVLDPPRKGAEEAFLRAVIASGAGKVLYISCDPGTLARDCRLLAEGGYSLKHVQPVDMFCQAKGVETVVLLEKQGNI